MLIEVLQEAFNDTLAMFPWLLGIYALLEVIERRYKTAITEAISHRMKAAPFLGALFGCIPQCGFSVIASALYTRRCISLGTLLAVFLSTSDEAVPVILAQKDKAHLIFGILAAKITIATLAGYCVDLFAKTPVHQETHPPHDPATCTEEHRHCSCHFHHCGEPWWKTYLLCPLKHTFRVSLFVFGVSFALGFLLEGVGENGLHGLFLAGTVFQPAAAVLIGLIPNCAASIFIAEIYLKGTISFGSAVAGLCASAGFGSLVLLRELKNRKELLRIVTLLAGISLATGLILNLLFPFPH